MKNILFTTFFLIISLSAFAQTSSIGIKGGINFATLSNSNNSLNTGFSAITTFNAGMFADIKFGNFSLQPALNYTGKGGSYTHSINYSIPYYLNIYPEPPITGPGTEKVKEQLYYLQLPVNIVYHIPVVAGNVYFGAGPYIAQGISGKTSYVNGGSVKATFGNGAGDIKAQQFGADAIVGFKLKGGLLINANYNIGLSNDIPASAGEGNSKSRVFGVSLGYVF